MQGTRPARPAMQRPRSATAWPAAACPPAAATGAPSPARPSREIQPPGPRWRTHPAAARSPPIHHQAQSDREPSPPAARESSARSACNGLPVPPAAGRSRSSSSTAHTPPEPFVATAATRPHQSEAPPGWPSADPAPRSRPRRHNRPAVHADDGPAIAPRHPWSPPVPTTARRRAHRRMPGPSTHATLPAGHRQPAAAG